MAESRDYLELTFRSINCFANDGRLDATELGELMAIALRDGVIDDNEKRVLANIVGRLSENELDTEMTNKVAEVKKLISD